MEEEGADPTKTNAVASVTADDGNNKDEMSKTRMKTCCLAKKPTKRPHESEEQFRTREKLFFCAKAERRTKYAAARLRRRIRDEVRRQSAGAGAADLIKPNDETDEVDSKGCVEVIEASPIDDKKMDYDDK